ncbi:MAG: hypothetical protein ACT4OV_15990 [Microthrixaceae bacterium]
MSPRALGAALAAAVTLLAACGGGSDAPASTTTSTTVSTTSTVPTTTTKPTPACDSVSVPAGATSVAEASGDLDGDGATDTLRSYLLGDAEWHLQVALAADGGADLVVTTGGVDAVTVLGGADVDGDGGDELWARTGSGASATILGFARFRDCALERVTSPGGEPIELPIGGTVGTASGAACGSGVGSAADLTVYTASNIEGSAYEITATAYELDGAQLVEQGTKSSSASYGDDAFVRASSFSCDGLGL